MSPRDSDSFPADQAPLRAHLAGILDVALDCIVTVDHDGRFIDFNPAAERTFGYKRIEVIGREMTDLIVPPALRERHRQGMARLLSGGAPRMLGQRIEISAMRADGREFPVELAITRVETGGANPVYAAHIRDITERQRTEGELMALHQRLESLLAQRTADLTAAQRELKASLAAQRDSQTYFEKSFHASPALMSIASATDFKLLEVNPEFVRCSGFAREEILGRTTLELGLWVHMEQRDEFIRCIRRDGMVRDFEADFRSKQGLIQSFLLNADRIELGGQPCMLTVGIDISERRRRNLIQAATYEVSQAVLGGDDLPTLLGRVHRIIAGLMSARNLYVALLSADRSVVTFPYFVDETMDPPMPRAPRNGITEFVIDTGEPILATDGEVVETLRRRGDYVPSGHPCAQWMGAPLKFEDRTIGVIALQDYRNPRAYTEEDKRLLMFVADQTAAVIHRQQAEMAQREARAYFETSFHTSPALMVISRLSDRHITEANGAFLRACGYSREEVIGRTADDLGLWTRPEQREEFFRRLREHGAIRDLECDFSSKTGGVTHFIIHADVIELGGAPSLLCVGIDITDRRRREKVQAATYAISQAVLAGGDLPSLFAELHRIVSTLISAKNFYVAVLSADRTQVSFPYFVDENASTPSTRRPGFGLTEYVLDSGKPLRTGAGHQIVLQRGDILYKPTGKPSALWLGAPLMIEGRAIGVLTVQDYHNPEAYTDADLQLLMFVADQAAVAVYRRQIEAAQRESRAFFETSFHSSPALMSINRFEDRRLIEVNPAFLRSSGYEREQVIGRTAQELGLWVHESQRLDFLERIGRDGFVRDLQADFRAKNGRVDTLLINADVLDLRGERCVLTVAIDVTERRRREQVQSATFQISRAVMADGDLETLFAEVHDIVGGLMSAKNFYVALLSADGFELSFPYFVDEKVQSPPSRAMGNGFTEHVLRTAKPHLFDAAGLHEALSGHGPYQPLEFPAAQRLGAPLIVNGRALGVIALQDYSNPRAYDAEDLRLLNFVAEQTAVAVQRRQAEEALARAEKRYRGIFENAVEGLYVSTPDGLFISANPALARIFGYDSVASLLTDVNDIGRQVYVRAERREEFFKLVQTNDQVNDFESEVFRRDGSTFWVSESVRVFRNAQGTIDHFEGVALDITARREAARALEVAKEAADTASRAKSYFLASVSHELRTPLNGILGYTQILRRDATLGEKQREGVRVIHESADHLLALINDVLDLSKIEAGRIELHPADIELPEFALGVERVFTPRAREKSILFETAVADDLPRWIRGDEQRLRQIVFNLVSNAVKFTKAGGVVFSVQRIEHASRGTSAMVRLETIRFSVSDTGPGIGPEDQAKLFQPFTQVGNKASAAATGTGLGLAISRSLVERMGGKLHVESTLGWGSRFWFDVTLPVVTEMQPMALATTRRIVGYVGDRRRILIVDDIAANRAVMLDMLAPLGFEIGEAADGEAAVREAESFKPDLVLMDLRLPGAVDGLEATRRIRRMPRAVAIRIVAVSASAYDMDRSECLMAGCDEFLAKPFREEDLWATIGRALNLTWNYAEAEETRTPFALPMYAPPVVEATAIYELAAKGDVVAIRNRAQALIALDPKYTPFAQNVLDLAARFKMKAIRQFVARYTQ
ncbi:MAG: PAS domain S-box protein [Verrucomicrobiota bacterium]